MDGRSRENHFALLRDEDSFCMRTASQSGKLLGLKFKLMGQARRILQLPHVKNDCGPTLREVINLNEFWLVVTIARSFQGCVIIALCWRIIKLQSKNIDVY